MLCLLITCCDTVNAHSDPGFYAILLLFYYVNTLSYYSERWHKKNTRLSTQPFWGRKWDLKKANVPTLTGRIFLFRKSFELSEGAMRPIYVRTTLQACLFHFLDLLQGFSSPIADLIELGASVFFLVGGDQVL